MAQRVTAHAVDRIVGLTCSRPEPLDELWFEILGRLNTRPDGSETRRSGRVRRGAGEPAFPLETACVRQGADLGSSLRSGGPGVGNLEAAHGR